MMKMKTRVSRWMLDNMVNMMTLTTKSPGDATTKLLGWRPETQPMGSSTAKCLGMNMMTVTTKSMGDSTVKYLGWGPRSQSPGNPASKWLEWRPKDQPPGDLADK